MSKRKFYVVWDGFAPGIYDTWEECQQQVVGYPNAKYKSFASQTEATEAFRGNDENEMYALRAIASGIPEPEPQPAPQPEPSPSLFFSSAIGKPTSGIAVDAACAGNPGPMEYRGVDLATGKQIFHFGPVANGTNNIGEFLAIVHALALCKKKGWDSVPIYSDSRTAMAWARHGKAKTTLPLSPENADWYPMIARAENWLSQNIRHNTVHKWQTEVWGEVPADFGRK
ncbi:MAG: ribonuclease H family protein [Muribaculum sp.]|nr:ribonuclease H family protein [Muribaculaceae bacterium]MCM1081561.1 ribonuclease H family protein [Muribaculum sp.]